MLFDFSKVPQRLNSEIHLIEEFWKTGCVLVIATSQVCHRLLAQEIHICRVIRIVRGPWEALYKSLIKISRNS